MRRGHIAADAAEEVARAIDVFGVATGQREDRVRELVLLDDLQPAGDVVRDVEAKRRLGKQAVRIAAVEMVPTPRDGARPVAFGVTCRHRRALKILGLQMSRGNLRAPVW